MLRNQLTQFFAFPNQALHRGQSVTESCRILSISLLLTYFRSIVRIKADKNARITTAPLLPKAEGGIALRKLSYTTSNYLI